MYHLISSPDGKEYLCKWKGLPYSECTWETEATLGDIKGLLHSYEDRERLKENPGSSPKASQKKNVSITSQPSFITTGTVYSPLP